MSTLQEFRVTEMMLMRARLRPGYPLRVAPGLPWLHQWMMTSSQAMVAAEELVRLGEARIEYGHPLDGHVVYPVASR